MPREPKPEVKTFAGPNGLVAAAIRLTGVPKARKPKRPPMWYQRGWDYYNCIGEFRYAVTWVGNLLSRAELQVWENGKQVTTGPAVEAMASFFGGIEGQREFLRQSGTHLTVPGDYYVVGEDQGALPDKWQVVSATRITRTGGSDDIPGSGTWKVGKRELSDPLVFRVWRPHPNDQEEADSPTRAVLDILAEIDGLTKHVMAQITSRLTNGGIFVIPNEMTFGSIRGAVTNGDETDGQVQQAGIDAFLLELYETMVAAIADPSDPTARMPIILQGPGEYLEKLRLITFWQELDAQAKELRDEAIRRLALGMDMPPEILTGSGELNHWNAWQVEEAAIKAHTEPLLQLITSAVTEGYLWPYLLDAMPGEDAASVRRFVVHADTAKIRLRPNRSKEAIELYDRGSLSREAMVRENGFDPGDIMTDDEFKDWQLRKVAAGSTTPELVAWALMQLGLAVPNASLIVNEGTEAPSDRSLTDHPERKLPDPLETDSAAAQVVVFRALERAGAKLRTKYQDRLVPGTERITNAHLYRYARVTPDIMDDLLAGAWDVCGETNVKASPVQLDAYVRHLFTTNEQFDPNSYLHYFGRL